MRDRGRERKSGKEIDRERGIEKEIKSDRVRERE